MSGDGIELQDSIEENPPGRAGVPEVWPEPPLGRMVLAVLALLGALVSTYLLAHELGLMGPLVCGVGSCEMVQASPYARLGPFPVAGLGLVGYLALLVTAVAGVQPRLRASRAVGVVLLSGSVVGVGFSAYLTWLEAAVIHAWCVWCVISAILTLLSLAAALPELRRITGRAL